MKSINTTIILALGTILFSCSQKKSLDCQNEISEIVENNTPETSETINTYVSIVEIPVNDINRATAFYGNLLDVEIENMSFDDIEMGILPYENQAVTFVLTKGDSFTPSSSGTTVYLNTGDDLQPILDKVEENGGKIIVPKTAHADENGFFALFLDSEGNNMGLSSIN